MRVALRFLLIVLLALAVALPVYAQSAASDVDTRISKVIDSISESRMEQMLRTLAGFGTRNTMSDPTSPTRGVGAARQWIFDELRRTNPKLQVSFDTHQIPKGRSDRITRDVELRNVVAVLPGRSPRRIYVSGHYDTVNLGNQGQAGLNTTGGGERNQNDNADAPGANEDAPCHRRGKGKAPDRTR